MVSFIVTYVIAEIGEDVISDSRAHPRIRSRILTYFSSNRGYFFIDYAITNKQAPRNGLRHQWICQDRLLTQIDASYSIEAIGSFN